MSEWTGLSPELFADGTIDEETRGIIKLVDEMAAAMPRTEDQVPAELRQARREGRGALPLPPLSDRAEVITIPGPGGDLLLRLLVPANPKGALLYLHGGGWTLGSSDGQDPLLEAMADRAELAVVSVEYRLAPEDPYPAAPDDCEVAALWLIKECKARFGTERLLLSGASAGAHLAAVTLLRLKDKHGLTPFAGVNFDYGCFDLNMTPSMANWGNRNLILDTKLVGWFCDNFVPPAKYDAAARRDPDISPLYGDLTGMPPARFMVGTMDPLLNDSLFMYARWIAAGNEAVLEIAPGGIHAFNAFPSALGSEFMARGLKFLSETGL